MPAPAPASGVTRDGAGAGFCITPVRAVTAEQQAEQRFSAGRDEWQAWERHVATVSGCSQPVRLRGSAHTIDARTGEVLDVYDAADAPDGVIYKACGTRRASVCPSCAETYRHDAYHLIRAGLAGSDSAGVPASVAEHPVIFLTLTAPSFGFVHGQRKRAGRELPCRARRDRTLCPHGRPTWCTRRHRSGDPALGKPLCPDCYDYDAHVIWNHHASELWRRTSMALRRRVTAAGKAHGVKLRISFGKVAEYQARGVVHFHALLRIDLVDGGGQLVPPPACLDVEDLAAQLATAASPVLLVTAPHPDSPGGQGWPVGWGRQIDARIVRDGLTTAPLPGAGEVEDMDVASYVAKYSTKSTEAAGLRARRLTPATIDTYDDDTHAGRLIGAAWQLGRPQILEPADENGRAPYDRLRAWAHMLGFGGHFLTKSRRYSTTFAERRGKRASWRRRHHRQRLAAERPDLFRDLGAEDDEETVLIVGQWTYVGSGWLSSGDQLLALQAAARAREYRDIVREETRCSA